MTKLTPNQLHRGTQPASKKALLEAIEATGKRW